MLIRITKHDLKRCEAFANEVVDTNNYYTRGQSNRAKIINDICLGKQAEVAVYKFLTDAGYQVTEVDFQVYSARDKSHGKDFLVNDVPIEIKSQSYDSMKKYGVSWLLETKAAEKLKDHLLITCAVLEDQYVMITHIDLFANAPLGKPKLSYLKTKSAIYMKEILEDKLKGLL